MVPSLMLDEFHYNFSLIENCFNIYIYSKFKAYDGPQLKLGVNFLYVKASAY